MRWVRVTGLPGPVVMKVSVARRELGGAACGRIVEHFSFERMGDQYEAVYVGLVKQGQR